MKADILRKKFLEFFETKKHKIVASDSLVPAGDPTVLFTSAGMNQFKKQFLGQTTGFTRAASCQKCLRTDDLDKVGKTPFHHTFFEMLGNFSFGDYFKEDAIKWAWEFLTEWLKIPQEKLWVSVYEGDNEAYKIWLEQVKISKDKIIKLGDKENFWPSEAKKKGPNGPCGPCSEIFFDYGKDVGCKKKSCNPSCDCGRFAEVWNLVFTQFNRKEGGTLEPLPSKNIDTGMGLERLAAVMQKVLSNFETDLFTSIIAAIKKETGISKPSKEDLLKIKIIADHIRAIVFAICDGVIPSNEDRGYIVRKLIRISVNNYRSLGIRNSLLYKVVSAVTDVMKGPYPEIIKRRENVSEIIKREEQSFLNIVEKQEIASEEKLKALRKEYQDDEKVLAVEIAKFAFELHDTYGYPFELTKETAKKLGLPIDEKAFKKLMEDQKERSRQSSMMAGDVFKEDEIKMDIKSTDFIGYEKISDSAKIIKILDDKNKELDKTKNQKNIKIILDKTPFYAESGGQVGDAGEISKDKESKIEVTDTKKVNNVTVHIGKIIKGEFKTGDKVIATVDSQRRLSIARNHTATHLLQAALRKVLGEHVQQQGSLVAEDRLRFDFTHFKQLAKDELNRIEELVNEYIMNNDCIQVKEKSTDAAKKEGALAFFAEKYSDKSRVVSVGGYSKELCGGTHLCSTGQIGYFKILGESSIAQGIRRIEATTGKFAYQKIKKEEELLLELAVILKTDKENLLANAKKIMSNLKVTQTKLDNIKLDSAKNSLDEIIKTAKDLDGIKVISYKIEDADFNVLRSTIDMLKKSLKNAVIALGSVKEGRALIVMGVSSDLKNKGLDASDMIKAIAGIVGGSGGGRQDFAQAGGTKTDKLNDALSKVLELVKGKIKK